MSGPRRLDNTSLEKAKPRTLVTYRAAAMKFANCLDGSGFAPDGPVEYNNDEKFTECNFECAAAAAVFVFP
eukprot:9260139-Pyramimonas_sp.AAC.1